MPFFAVSANAPLLQSWFAHSGHPHAPDPYFLYGASNFGSLIALLAYPVALEPAVGVSMQARVWGGGFVLLALLIAACGVLSIARGTSTAAAVSEDDDADASSLVWSQRTRWAALAFVPSGLLVAFTGYLTADLASVPFLWVIPLALFLVTFILAFRERSLPSHQLLLKAQPLLVAGAFLAQSALGDGGWLLTVAIGFGAFFVTAMVCHRELYDLRPAPRHLTEFYVWISLGGVLGGTFAALLAPQLFNAVYEFPILLVLGLACRPGLAAALADRGEVTAGSRLPLMLLVVVAAIALGLALFDAPDILQRIVVLPPLAVAAFLMLATRELPFRLLAYATVGGLTLLLLPSALSRGTAERSFFGMHRVLLEGGGSVRVLMHGTTIYGAERIRDKSGNPIAHPLPATYFYPRSPLARGVAAARQVGAEGPGRGLCFPRLWKAGGAGRTTLALLTTAWPTHDQVILAAVASMGALYLHVRSNDNSFDPGSPIVTCVFTVTLLPVIVLWVMSINSLAAILAVMPVDYNPGYARALLPLLYSHYSSSLSFWVGSSRINGAAYIGRSSLLRASRYRWQFCCFGMTVGVTNACSIAPSGRRRWQKLSPIARAKFFGLPQIRKPGFGSDAPTGCLASRVQALCSRAHWRCTSQSGRSSSLISTSLVRMC